MLVLIAALMAAPEATADPGKKDDPIVCRRENELATGTHMRSKRVCMHKSEWDYIEKYTEEELRKIDDRRRGMQPRTGMGARGGGR